MKSLLTTRSFSLVLLLAVSGVSGLMATTYQIGLQTANPSLATSASQDQIVSSGQFTPADDQGRYASLIEFNEPGLLELHRQARQQERFDAVA